MKRFFSVALSLVFSTVALGDLSAKTFISSNYIGDNMLGSGMLDGHPQPIPSCVQGEQLVYSNPNTKAVLESGLVHSTNFYEHFFNEGLGLFAESFITNTSVRTVASLLNRKEDPELNTTFGIELETATVKLANASPVINEYFLESCGYHYIDSIKYGASARLHLSVVFASNEIERAVKGRVSVSLLGGLLKRSREVVSVLQEHSESIVVFIDFDSIGFNVPELLGYGNHFKQYCYIEDYLLCIDLYERYYNFLTNSEQLNTSLVQSTSEIRGVVTKYSVEPYSGPLFPAEYSLLDGNARLTSKKRMVLMSPVFTHYALALGQLTKMDRRKGVLYHLGLYFDLEELAKESEIKARLSKAKDVLEACYTDATDDLFLCESEVSKFLSDYAHVAIY